MGNNRAVSDGASLNLNESAGDLRNKTFQPEQHNNSCNNFNTSSYQNMNKTMIAQAKLEAQLMMEKKRNVKQSRQNMEQLKNRIDALKRNVEKVQKKESLAQRERQT